MKEKPLDLVFTASDARKVDFAALRGKVVLLDFWASWCGPCLGELPNVVATYRKYQAQGFEVVGVSLDEDRAAMESAMRKFGVDWPQFFDGKGFENEFAISFAIRSIPDAWLFDRKGLLRRTNLRGEELPLEVEKLLAE